ncbi:dTDP-4-dehydrorhamnose 3,5-epimerase family protein [uncultured Sphingomonas sp.]|uniref:dTDP-4-dehydrorhamnose 3,5-epimerase family protein n=1 Tax=uncultured Sphingomonas sp. TaxID=158754 RepID=UPI0035CA6B96
MRRILGARSDSRVRPRWPLALPTWLDPALAARPEPPGYTQGKLVRCIRGHILDVALDVPRGSPPRPISRCRTVGGNGCQQLVPAGFVHRFVTLVSDTGVT